jgi:hypothetical protein
MSIHAPQHDDAQSAVPAAIARSLAVVGLAGVALIHLLDAHDTFVSSPYQGWLYVALIVGSLTTAAILVERDDPRAWSAALLLPLGAFGAFVYSRTVGLPGGAEDVGNWWEPLGLASLFVEGALVALAGRVLWDRAQVGEYPERQLAQPRLERSLR